MISSIIIVMQLHIESQKLDIIFISDIHLN